MSKSKINNKAQSRRGWAKVEVKKSSAGLGLFALEPIKRGQLVVEYTGDRISSEEADKRGGRYLFDVDRGLVIDGKGRENLARYINHACKPNAYAERDMDQKRVFIYARKKIDPGEEISYNYGKSYLEGIIGEGNCQCKTCLSK